MYKKLKKPLIFMTIIMVALVGVIWFSNRNKLPSFDYKNVEMIQLNPPKAGQEIATIDTTLGTFKVMLFREEASNTVAHFVDLAKAGFYDGKYIFSAEKNAYFLGGTTNKSGVIVKKGEPNYDAEMTKIENELSNNLWPLKGALMSFGPNFKDSGSFFCGVNTVDFTDKLVKQLKNAKNANPLITNALIEKGGIPYFAQQYTIFAQTYEGIDVFEKITNVATDKKTKAIKEDVKINSIVISTFS